MLPAGITIAKKEITDMKAAWVSVGLVGVILAAGCATRGYQQNPQAYNYGATGAGMGAIVGAMAGNNVKGLNRGEGAVAGATLGAIIGAAMGAQQDSMNQQIGAVNEAATTAIVNVKNSNGSYTPVMIRKVGNQFVGPRGEYYNAMPTEEQLKGPYGF
jgi:hypothetical protein